MPTKTEEKRVKLSAHPFLVSLTGLGSTYQGEPLDKVIKVVACEGECGDWTAYMENPQLPWANIADYGLKLPREVAESIFPEWAQRLNWRP